ncbi:hypothetical protein P691DRAFT_775728 [Macrolepiota fuliginosa MF-IS2]|uniref:Uncharacterized protein n=1 Tax=Macrolepiota fuliginosa MF-IS2 TaxID=1400762 RepID=A0A9P5XB00_9AGAR|nr:hypothetical protein P691DRAFT_775728 [Macrolepiota fuliginosa MF-IS2]
MLSLSFSRVMHVFILSIFLATFGISTSAAEALPAPDIELHDNTPTPTQPALPNVQIPNERERRDKKAPKVNVRVGRPLKQFNPRGVTEKARMLRKRGNSGGSNGGASPNSEYHGIVEVPASKPSPWFNHKSYGETVHQVGEVKLDGLTATSQANNPTSYGAANDQIADLSSGIKDEVIHIV